MLELVAFVMVFFLFWQLTVDTGSRIELIVVGEGEGVENDLRAIVEIARREGLVVKVLIQLLNDKPAATPILKIQTLF